MYTVKGNNFRNLIQIFIFIAPMTQFKGKTFDYLSLKGFFYIIKVNKLG